MKKIALFLAGVVMNFAAYAALPNGSGEFEVDMPLFNGNYEFGASAMFTKVAAPELDYALVYSTPASEGRYKSARPSYDFGFNFFIGYLFPCSGNDVRLTYTDYEQKNRSHAGAPEGTVLPTTASPFVANAFIPEVTADVVVTSGGIIVGVFPDTTLFAPAAVPVRGIAIEGDVKDTIRQGCIDLDFGQYVNIDNFIRLRLFAGLRYARLKNNFNTNYVIALLDTEQTQNTIPLTGTGFTVTLTSTMTLNALSQVEELIRQTSVFNGIGPRVGVDGSFHIGGGFGLIGGISTAMLIGNQQSALSKVVNGNIVLEFSDIDFTFSGTPGFDPGIGDIVPGVGTIFTTPLNIVEDFDFDHTTRIVPNLQANIGINYTLQLQNCKTITLELGYFVNNYFNGIDRLSEVASTAPLLGPRHTIDVGFAGPYFSIDVTL